jgi:hypothetical protein
MCVKQCAASWVRNAALTHAFVPIRPCAARQRDAYGVRSRVHARSCAGSWMQGMAWRAGPCTGAVSRLRNYETVSRLRNCTGAVSRLRNYETVWRLRNYETVSRLRNCTRTVSHLRNYETVWRLQNYETVSRLRNCTRAVSRPRNTHWWGSNPRREITCRALSPPKCATQSLVGVERERERASERETH